jgi:hypothetical protein
MKNKPFGRTHVGLAMTVILVAVGSLGLSACVFLPQKEPPAPEVVQAPPPEPPPPEPAALYQWYGDGRNVSHIEVDVDTQKAVFYDGQHQIGWTRVASGVRKFPTPTGEFAVTEKQVNKRSNIYGKIYNRKGKLVRSNAELGVHPIPAGGRFEGAKMPYFLRLTNDGIGFHAGPIPKPGNPASHGCIRLPGELAQVLYAHVDIGTSVNIVGSGPSYGAYLASQRKRAARRAPANPTPPAETVVAAAEGTTDAAPAAGAAVPGGADEAAPTAIPAEEPVLAQDQASTEIQSPEAAKPEATGPSPASAGQIADAAPTEAAADAPTTAESIAGDAASAPTTGAPPAPPTDTAAELTAPAAPAVVASPPPAASQPPGPASGMADAAPPPAPPADAPGKGKVGQDSIETGALAEPIPAPTGSRLPEES